MNDEKGLRTFQKEANANAFAEKTMRSLGIRVPRDTVRRGADYVNRKKRHGDNIKASRQ